MQLNYLTFVNHSFAVYLPLSVIIERVRLKDGKDSQKALNYFTQRMPCDD